MKDQIIEDIRNALQAKAFLPALALTLTIPDICSSGYGYKPYCDWYNKYVLTSENRENRYLLSATECYAFRCSFLHQMDTDIDSQKILKEQFRKHIFRINDGDTSVLFYDEEIDKYVKDISISIFINQMIAGYKLFLSTNPSFDFKINEMSL